LLLPTQLPEVTVPGPKLRVAIVGCGDVAHRHYLPPIVALADRAEIVGCCDARLETAERLAAALRATSPGVTAFDQLEEMLARVRPDAVFNLTPAPFHAQVTSACLAAGAHVYSEKPISASVAEADRLIADAAAAGRLLMCAPGSAASRQVRWLREIVDSGSLGRPTLAVAQCASMGPADWAEYTGDPTVFYGPGVGPVRDLGIYRLHEMTALLGPVRRVSATGTIAIPERTILGGLRAGQKIAVTTPDHVLMHLEFAGGALGQLLSSFAAPATQAPWLEIHLTGGSISLAGDQYAADSAASFFVRGDAPAVAGTHAAALAPALARGWNHGLTPPPPTDRFPVIGRGAEHFLACLAGDEQPILTAEHARHVLEIVLLAYESIADGRVKELTTTF
jgi:predicted dehydrogenase